MSDIGSTIGDWLAVLGEPALVIGADGEMLAANMAFARIVGSFEAGAPFSGLVSTGSEDLNEQIRIWARNKQPVAGALSLKTSNGDFRAAVQAGRLSGLLGDGQIPILLLRFKPQQEITGSFRTLTEQVDALTREVSTRKRAEQELIALKESLEERVARRTAQLSKVAGRLIEAEEAERSRIAHILHDNLQQLLVGASYQIERLNALSDDPVVGNVIRALREVVQESITVSRSLTLDLSPPVLHESGLCAALAWLARRNQEQHGLDVVVQVDETVEPADEQVRIALFTAARELLFNIVKHAGVRTASLVLTAAGGDRVVLQVRDEGAGFDLGGIEEQQRGGGFGLFSLRERAEIMGGEVRIHSAPGQGTTVEVEMHRESRAQ